MTAPATIRNAAWYAEQAVLGAAVRRPATIGTGDAALNGTEFTDLQHAILWNAVIDLQPGPGADPATGQVGIEPAPAAIRRVMNYVAVSGAEASDPIQMPDLSRILIEAVKAAPSNFYEIAVYQRIVREATARRVLEALKVRAVTPDMVSATEARPVSLTAQELADRKRALSNVYKQARPAADAIAPTAPLPAALIVRQERVLIRAMLADAQVQRRGLLELFQPEDFTSSEHATIWRLMQIAQARDRLVTPITVAWAAETVSPGTLTVSQLTDLIAGPTAAVMPAVAVVARVAWMRCDALAKELPGSYARSGEPASSPRADRLIDTATTLGGHKPRRSDIVPAPAASARHRQPPSRAVPGRDPAR